MTRYKATIRLTLEVEFEDDGKNNLNDQAFECLDSLYMPSTDLIADADKEIVGRVERTRTRKARRRTQP